jgi:hypothetical protein
MLILWAKTEAAFDIWSIEHLVSGMVIGAIVDFIVKKYFLKWEKVSRSLELKIDFILVLTISIFWENLEHYIEVWLWWQRVEVWMQWVEHWSNRLIFDDTMVLLGWFIRTKQNKVVWFARIFSFVWIFFHIFVFPDCMYLQRVIEKWFK